MFVDPQFPATTTRSTRTPADPTRAAIPPWGRTRATLAGPGLGLQIHRRRGLTPVLLWTPEEPAPARAAATVAGRFASPRLQGSEHGSSIDLAPRGRWSVA
jgi:hypothetical protein